MGRRKIVIELVISIVFQFEAELKVVLFVKASLSSFADLFDAEK